MKICALLNVPFLFPSLSALYSRPLDFGDPKDRQCENIKCIAALCSKKIAATAKDLFFLFATLKKKKKKHAGFFPRSNSEMLQVISVLQLAFQFKI